MKILSNKRIFFFKRLWLMSNGWYWSHLILCSICFILISPYSLLDLLEPIQRQRRTSETKHDSNIFAFNTPTYYLTWNMYQNHYTALKVIRFISWRKYGFKISTKHQLQNIDQIFVNTLFSINNRNTKTPRTFELALSKARVTSVKSHQHQLVSELVTRADNDQTRVDKNQIKFLYILCIQVGSDCTLILQLVLPSILPNHPPLKRKYAFNTSLPSFGSENVCRI